MMDQRKPAKTEQVNSPWQDLVASILLVNRYTLERTYQSIPALEKQGLFDPENLIRWDQKEIMERLKLGGCDRGPFMTNLFALRLASLGEFLGREFDICAEVLGGKDARQIEQLLMPVNGIGPRVLYNFFLLREIKK
jgi:hypothetical protein